MTTKSIQKVSRYKVPHIRATCLREVFVVIRDPGSHEGV